MKLAGLKFHVDYSARIRLELSFAFREKIFDFEPKVPSALKFVFGAVAGCGAATAVQPMNLVKNRMQVKFEFPKVNFCLKRAKFYKNRFRAKVEQFDCTRVLGTVQRLYSEVKVSSGFIAVYQEGFEFHFDLISK